MSTETDIEEIWSQLKRQDLRGIIAVTNGAQEYDKDITAQVENALSELKRLQWMLSQEPSNTMSTASFYTLNDLLQQTLAAISLSESGVMVAMCEQDKRELVNKYGSFDFIIGDFLIKRIHGEGANTPLACDSEEVHNANVSERREHENDHLVHALHDMRVELIRTTEGLRSLSIVLTKTDLGNTEKINMKISELAGGLNEVKTSALKAFSEVRNRIDAADARIVILEKSLADADIPAEAEAAFADLKTIHKQLDDIVPDAPELPPVVTPPTPV